MFKGAAAFYQDITGWTTTSLTTSTGMFTGATAWLDRVQRGDGTGTSTDGPIERVGPQAVPRGRASAVRLVRAVRRRRDQTGGRRPILG